MSSRHKKKLPIRVIKQRAPASKAAPTEVAAPLRSDQEIEVVNDGDTAMTIKRWIGERRENRRVESVFSDTQLANWKLDGDTSK